MNTQFDCRGIIYNEVDEPMTWWACFHIGTERAEDDRDIDVIIIDDFMLNGQQYPVDEMDNHPMFNPFRLSDIVYNACYEYAGYV